MDLYQLPPQPAERPADGFLRRVCASPVYLAAAIVFSLSALLALASNLTGTLPSLRQLFEGFRLLLRQASYLGSDLVSCLVAMLLAVVASLIHTLVVPLCFAVAMWLIYAFTRQSKGAAVPTGGLTVTRSAAILSLVLQYFAYAGLLWSITYLLVKLGVMAAEYHISLGDILHEALTYLPQRFLVTLGLYFLLSLVAMVLSVLQTVLVLKMATDTVRALRCNTAPPRPTAAVGGTLIFSGLFNLASPFLTAHLLYVAMSSMRLGVWMGYGDALDATLGQLGPLAKVVWVLGTVSPIVLAVLVFVARGIWKRPAAPVSDPVSDPDIDRI